jgi:hypothetical protein
MYLSLGPDPRAAGDQINGPKLYLWLYEAIPGFDGLRVPARFAAIAVLFLVMVAAYGLRDVFTRWPRRAALVAAIVCAGWLAEAAMIPFPIAMTVGAADSALLNDPPYRVDISRNPPLLYVLVRGLPESAILLELPFADASWEVRYQYSSTLHWRRIVNGYSGYAPRTYLELADVLRNPYKDPELAWRRVVAAGVTHIVVHGDAYKTEAPAPYAWLDAMGALQVIRAGNDAIYRVPR